jgi:hypothetical protein
MSRARQYGSVVGVPDEQRVAARFNEWAAAVQRGPVSGRRQR